MANGKILREGPFKKLWIQPAAGDAGGALGAALMVWHQMLDNPRSTNGKDTMKGSWLGPEFSDQEISRYLDSVGAVSETLSDADLADRVARADG